MIRIYPSQTKNFLRNISSLTNCCLFVASPFLVFLSVKFPNPEENGSLDIAKAFADAEGCEIILANDPDADRLAVAEKDRSTGNWTIFSGDQIGTMLGLWIWESIGKHSDKVGSEIVCGDSCFKNIVWILRRGSTHIYPFSCTLSRLVLFCTNSLFLCVPLPSPLKCWLKLVGKKDFVSKNA